MEKIKRILLGFMFLALISPVTACNTYEDEGFENEEQLDPVKERGMMDSEVEIEEREGALNDLEKERGSYEHQGY